MRAPTRSSPICAPKSSSASSTGQLPADGFPDPRAHGHGQAAVVIWGFTPRLDGTMPPSATRRLASPHDHGGRPPSGPPLPPCGRFPWGSGEGRLGLELGPFQWRPSSSTTTDSPDSTTAQPPAPATITPTSACSPRGRCRPTRRRRACPEQWNGTSGLASAARCAPAHVGQHLRMREVGHAEHHPQGCRRATRG